MGIGMVRLGGLMMNESSFKISQLLESAMKSIGSYAKYIVIIVGLIMIVAGIIKIAKALISHGKTQTNWFINIALIAVGALLIVTSGWDTLTDFGSGVGQSIDDMGKGTADEGEYTFTPGDTILSTMHASFPELEISFPGLE